MSRAQTHLFLASLLLIQGFGALADSTSLFGQPTTSAPKSSSPPAATTPAPAPATGTATSPTTPSATQSPKAATTDSAPRGPSSADPNVYHPAGGSFSSQGSPAAKEPVIDGKAIPKVIDFSGGSPMRGSEPSAVQLPS